MASESHNVDRTVLPPPILRSRERSTSPSRTRSLTSRALDPRCSYVAAMVESLLIRSTQLTAVDDWAIPCDAQNVHAGEESLKAISGRLSPDMGQLIFGR